MLTYFHPLFILKEILMVSLDHLEDGLKDLPFKIIGLMLNSIALLYAICFRTDSLDYRLKKK